MGINITSHAVMRYIQRSKPELLVLDSTWEKWKKNNLEEINANEKEILKLVDASEYIMTGSINKHGESEFYINKSKMFTFVIKNGNLVTCYPITFSLDKQGDMELYEVLRGNLQRLNISLEEREEELKKLELNTSCEIAEIDNEISGLFSKIDILKQKKSLLENGVALEKSKVSECKAKIRTTQEKIVRSKMAI